VEFNKIEYYSIPKMVKVQIVQLQ